MSDSRTVTTNGDACLKIINSSLLDLFFKLVRGFDVLASLFSAAVTEATEPVAKVLGLLGLLGLGLLGLLGFLGLLGLIGILGLLGLLGLLALRPPQQTYRHVSAIHYTPEKWTGEVAESPWSGCRDPLTPFFA